MSWQELWARARRWYAGHSERDRRIILGVAVLIGLAIGYVLVIEPIRDYRRAVAEEIDEGRDRVERWARQVGALDAVTAERDELQRRLAEARKRLLPGTSGTLGAAALQERANAIAAEKGITVQSTQVMREEPADPFRKVTVRLMLSGELRPFAELVAGLEYGPQQLTLPFVEVSRRGAVAGVKGPRTLTATVEVSGYQLAAPEAGEAEAEGEPQAEAAAGDGSTTTTSAPPDGTATTTTPAPAESGTTSTVASDGATTTTTVSPGEAGRATTSTVPVPPAAAVPSPAPAGGGEVAPAPPATPAAPPATGTPVPAPRGETP